jgi:hypothetical protein
MQLRFCVGVVNLALCYFVNRISLKTSHKRFCVEQTIHKVDFPSARFSRSP